ncbi:MAG: hypothetical protein AABY53_04775 [Bdellovibrionota bacterium]
MKTPSFLELKTLVEYLTHELQGSQLQEVMSTEEGLVLSFYRFNKDPRISNLVFDLDRPFPFLGYFFDNPWSRQKKTKPISLFMTAHAKNHHFKSIEVFEELGRVVKLSLDDDCLIEFRLIPRQTNLIVKKNKKSISWYPVKDLAQNDPNYTLNTDLSDGEEVRSISFMMKQWLRRRGGATSNAAENVSNPFEIWKKNKEKDLAKKKKALVGVEEQINKFINEEWSKVGEYLKTYGLKNLKPEWSVYIDYKKSVSVNMQNCFEKSKAAKSKIKGAESRLAVLKQEIALLSNLTLEKYEQFLNLQNSKKNKVPDRKIEGRLRKTLIEESGVVAYMGKSAADNMSLLRKSKPNDLWLHLKDYPSAHAIIHVQKNLKISDLDIKRVATWLVKEGLSEKKTQLGGKFSVVIVECRHVKPLKGDKLGRVTYHNAHEILIAI